MTRPCAFFFGGDRHLFGWYHAPHGTHQRPVAALICPPLGYEYMCAHRALRHLAHGLADAGIPTLRFDYYATGDSGGSTSEAGLVPHWIASIHAAADELRKLSGCDTIALIGLRMGATLAAHVAAKRTDVDTLVLWAPCTDGRSFIRENRMQSGAAAANVGIVTDAEDGLHASGFHFAATTIADIETLTLGAADIASLRRTLLVTRDGAGANDRLRSLLSERLGGSEGRWSELRTTTYDAFMVSPVFSRLPLDTLDAIVAWTASASARTCAARGPADAPGPQPVAVPGTTTAIVEEAVVFGDDLFGVLTKPAAGSRRAAIVLNTGADHHVGPHRIYVGLARTWSQEGIAVLRFDLRGLGDSGPLSQAPLPESYPLTALSQIDAAVEFMREHCNALDIVLVGVCTGAYHALHALAGDTCAAIAVNPQLYWQRGDPIRVPSFDVPAWRKWRMVLTDPARVMRSIGNRVRSVTALRPWTPLLALYRRSAWVFHRPRLMQRAGRHALGMIARSQRVDLFPRDARIALVFGDADAGLRTFDASAGVRLGALQKRSGITVDIVSGFDHVFMGAHAQRALTRLLTRHLYQLFADHRVHVEHTALTETSSASSTRKLTPLPHLSPIMSVRTR